MPVFQVSSLKRVQKSKGTDTVFSKVKATAYVSSAFNAYQAFDILLMFRLPCRRRQKAADKAGLSTPKRV